MVKFYVDRIKRGAMTLDQVPARWHDEVARALGVETPAAGDNDTADSIADQDAQEDAQAVHDAQEDAQDDDDGAAD